MLKEFCQKLGQKREGWELEIGSDLTLATFRYLTGKEQREREQAYNRNMGILRVNYE